MVQKNKECRILNGPEMPMIGETDMKPYNFKEIGSDSVEVNMYGQVVENRPIDWRTGKPSKGLYIVLAEFLKDLDIYKEKGEITFRINSVGGDLVAGVAIYNRMTELKGDTVAVVDGLAASAASVILQGAKKRKVFAGSRVMVHGASIFMFGRYNLQELKKVADRIEGGNKSILEIYESRTGKKKEFLRGLMEKEEWMTGKEAIENGFADELVETGRPAKLEVTADGKSVIANGIWMPMEGFLHLPKGIPVAEVAVASSMEAKVIENVGLKKQETGGRKDMDIQELKEKYPGLVQQIQQEAVADAGKGVEGGNADHGETEKRISDAVEEERRRLKEIDEIAGQIADEKLVQEAKFGEKAMTAPELAFEAMKRQKNTGEQYLMNMKGDARDSGVFDVDPAPNCGEKTTKEQEMEDVEAGAQLIAKGWQ